MEEDPKVVILVISNLIKNVELFRVHIHEQSIRFDDNFMQGIIDNPDLSIEIEEINFLWKNQKLAPEQIYPKMLYLMNKYGDYLRDFYFKDYELDDEGHYIEDQKIFDDKPAIHFNHLKKTKRLKKISRKEFEKQLSGNEEVATFYVDNYVKKGAKFYMSEKKVGVKLVAMWYFMVVNDAFKISFSVDCKPEK